MAVHPESHGRRHRDGTGATGLALPGEGRISLLDVASSVCLGVSRNGPDGGCCSWRVLSRELLPGLFRSRASSKVRV